MILPPGLNFILDTGRAKKFLLKAGWLVFVIKKKKKIPDKPKSTQKRAGQTGRVRVD